MNACHSVWCSFPSPSPRLRWVSSHQFDPILKQIVLDEFVSNGEDVVLLQPERGTPVVVVVVVVVVCGEQSSKE